jgi:hypothetical protein
MIVNTLEIKTPIKLKKIDRFDGIINEPPSAIETIIAFNDIKIPVCESIEICKKFIKSIEKAKPTIERINIILEKSKIAKTTITPATIVFCKIKNPKS